MSAFQRDFYIRIVATVLASAAGTAVAYLAGLPYWWAAGFAAAGTVLRGLLVLIGGGAGMPTVSILERTAWTALEAFVAAVPVAGVGIPPFWLPVFAAVLAAVKGWLAKRVGNPDNAATLPRRVIA